MGVLSKFFFRNTTGAVPLCVVLCGTVISSAVATESPPLATSSDAVRGVFDVSIVRPLQRASFEPLRKYFSVRQQKKIDEFLRASDDLMAARSRLAQRLGIQEQSWWPSTVDSFRISSVLSQGRDLLIERSEKPKEIKISSPSQAENKVQIIVRERFDEFGQDRYLGVAAKRSEVRLLPENGRWVIDEIVSTVLPPEGKTESTTLTRTLENASKLLRTAERHIKNLPQTLEVRKGVKAKN